MAYVELPQPAPLVTCLWHNDPAPVPVRRPVLPDACADIVWIGGQRLLVAGPATGPKPAFTPAGTAVMGVRFRLGAAGAALGFPASELLDRTVPLEDVWGAEGARIEERLGEADAEDQLAVLASEVRARLDGELDRTVRAAATAAAGPRVRVDELAALIGIGDRHLRRRFADAVGYGPKTLQRVLRFQRFLALARAAGDGAELALLALDAGYADQAHLTRECRRLAGLTPVALLESGAAPAGDGSVPFKTARLGTASMAA